MAIFERQEAFDFIHKFLGVENAEERMQTDKRDLLDELAMKISSRLPFQNVTLLSVPPSQRRKPSLQEVKVNFTSGIGGLCIDLNVITFYLLSAIGYDVSMVHGTVSTTIISYNNHICLIIHHLQRPGDQFLFDIASGYPTLQAIDLSFEKESQVYFNAMLEFKFVKQDGKLLRMHRKGDFMAMGGPKENSEVEFWLGDWRRFYFVEIDRQSKDYTEFEHIHQAIYTDPTTSPFHYSHRVVLFPEGKASMVVNEKAHKQNEAGELVTTVLRGGDDEIKAAIQNICPVMSDDLLTQSLRHWRQVEGKK